MKIHLTVSLVIYLVTRNSTLITFCISFTINLAYACCIISISWPNDDIYHKMDLESIFLTKVWWFHNGVYWALTAKFDLTVAIKPSFKELNASMYTRIKWHTTFLMCQTGIIAQPLITAAAGPKGVHTVTFANTVSQIHCVYFRHSWWPASRGVCVWEESNNIFV